MLTGISYNQPKFCPNASWDQNAVTFADSNLIGGNPWKVFITKNDTVYVANRVNKQIILFSQTNSIQIRNISTDSEETHTIFVTENGDIYFDYEKNSTVGIRKSTSNLSTYVLVTDVYSRCYDIFVDIHNYIYCSMDLSHQVIRKSLNNTMDYVNVIAGTGIAGSTSYMFNGPNGIFVDTNFDLYVADFFNNRIQLFPLDQTNGITVAGSSSSTVTIALNGPVAVTMDADKYLFIVDRWNHRAIRSGPYGFQCVVGCNGSGSAANQLNGPRSMSFDKHGNIFVADENNNRIQKFVLLTNSCISLDQTTVSSINNGISYNQPIFHRYAVWNPNGITIANINDIGIDSVGIFINRNNTIYVPNRENSQIKIWMNDDMNPPSTIYTDSIHPVSIFVTINGDIYIDNQNSSYQISKWTLNSNKSDVIMYIDTSCFDLFIDINNTLYCSMRIKHKIVTKSLSSSSNVLTIVAGTGYIGSTSTTFNCPSGIFVDDNFALYVADYHNDRIQLFQSGTFNAITIAGSTSSYPTITLHTPIDVILDGKKNIFIIENDNNRIIASTLEGFRCIVGCSSLLGSQSDQLYHPKSMAFDSHGNIYVLDQDNNRMQKFLLLNNTFREYNCQIIFNLNSTVLLKFTVPSYNQPKFCSNATWNPNATTIANSTLIGSQSDALFINNNNTIFAVNNNNNKILIWFEDSIYPNRTLYGNWTLSKSMFVTNNGDIYIDNGLSNQRIDKFTMNMNESIHIRSVSSNCFGIFVDISNSIYCSIDIAHRVYKKWLGDNMTTFATVAGNGISGSAANLLASPNGIFVDINFDLYVADFGNNRVQLFRLGQLDGITVAGNTSLNITITLNRPLYVLLDGNKYLFIADNENHRIIGSDVNGFRCIVGCSGSQGSASNQLSHPRTIAFDSFGNLLVMDIGNSRIQKFLFQSNSCHHFQDEITTQLTPHEILVVPYFIPNCHDTNTIGTNCNISSNLCNLLDPCKNDGICWNSTSTDLGYICNCSKGFTGPQCQQDTRLCKPTTCWNNGTCNEILNTTFKCSCQQGWTGNYCEKMINYCENISCQNNAPCRPLFMNYTCECLTENYSGRYCEIVSTKLAILQFVSKSFGYIAIIFLVVVVGFIVIMDVLKYGFGIDPVKHELERIRHEKKPKRRPIIQRFTYVNT